MFVLWYGSRVHHRELHAAPARLERNDNSPPPCADLAAARRALQRHLPRRTVHITQPGLPSDGVRRARGRAMVPQHDARLALRTPRGAHATVCRALPAAVGRAVQAYARTDALRESHRAYRSPQDNRVARGAPVRVHAPLLRGHGRLSGRHRRQIGGAALLDHLDGYIGVGLFPLQSASSQSAYANSSEVRG